MTALPQAALPLLRPRRAKKVLYGRKQRQDHNGAWGELLPGSFDSVGLALRFVGALGVRTDLETDLLYMRHRWYDATLQRFISRDPIGLYGGNNVYVYVGNDPTLRTDPRGLDEVGPPGHPNEMLYQKMQQRSTDFWKNTQRRQTRNLQDAINFVKRIDPQSGNDLDGLLDTGVLRTGPVRTVTLGNGVALTLRDFKTILIDYSIVKDCPGSEHQLWLASILVHELHHYRHQSYPILKWAISAIDAAPRELEQVEAQRDFVNQAVRSGQLDNIARDYAEDQLIPGLNQEISNLKNFGAYNRQYRPDLRSAPWGGVDRW